MIGYIIDRGEMIVALVDKQTPPWFFKDKEGTIKGADVELAKEIAKELGVNVRFYQKASSYMMWLPLGWQTLRLAICL
ncbi:MAG: transporter substrate-binding domain-containing protein [bacterium]|nr:transporter substrate-binding domain-containing protein [bacterium]